MTVRAAQTLQAENGCGGETDRRTERLGRKGKREGGVYACSRLLYCRRLTRQRPKQPGAAGSTASSGRTEAEEPARTKLMGNCSDWLLPSLETGLEGQREGRAEVREMGGDME